MNATIEKFGYPQTLIHEYESWVVLLRPQQATLGALVVACKESAEAFGDISPEAMTELSSVTRDIEAAASKCFSYQKINYLMLMMVDPHVHFHVLPRYEAPRSFESIEFSDPGWPGPPQIGSATATDATVFEKIRQQLVDAWHA